MQAVLMWCLVFTKGVRPLLPFMMGRELHDMALVIASMLVIVVIGLLFDRLIFQSCERYIQTRWGLLKS